MRISGKAITRPASRRRFCKHLPRHSKNAAKKDCLNLFRRFRGGKFHSLETCCEFSSVEVSEDWKLATLTRTRIRASPTKDLAPADSEQTGAPTRFIWGCKKLGCWTRQ